MSTKCPKGMQTNPGAISHHSSVMHGRTMYLFGGNMANGDENTNIFSLDIDKLMWNTKKAECNDFVLHSRDEHTAVVHKNKMYIFAGFEKGVRKNTIMCFDFDSNKWSSISVAEKETQPPPRAGHSACVYGDSMYVFGGKDEDNEKLKDFWSFNFESKTWTELS